ncbi:type II and III secretion system protein family protein [Devosia sp. YIM 151766]|uniref:type II and III secretion system protein family protein n=1 Tax=Devosia sp. YIM 151766 TaxID=3017325 RepID=UPI00255C7DA4|nr:type II and III secretion system protein family protein [Devosia sp. YIM 151766]WIY53323.1 type II and III secretion system protein family protein [Devosia sp. YIM 151766]
MENVTARKSRHPARAVLLASAALMALLAPAAPAFAQAQAQVTISASAYGAVRKMDVELNKSMIIDLPAGVAEVIVSQPQVAAAIMRTRTRAIVQGVTGGDTNIFFLDDNGRTIQVLDLRVIEQPSMVGNALESALARVIPGSRIRVESVTLGGDTNRVVLTGSVPTAEDKERAQAIAVQFAGDPLNVANVIDVSGAQQVMLQVTVSEIRRDVAKQLGINLSGSATIGNVGLGFNSTTTIGDQWGPHGANASFPIGDVQFNAELKALENRNALRLLAQPVLTAMSGQSAEFLVGGEFPISSRDSNGATSTIFKEYGVKLNFTPTVKSNGAIGLAVDTGVSELLAGSASLSRRDVKTTVELSPGMTLAIGGLLSEASSRDMNQIPGLGNIPILGALFRSNEYRSQQTELVILVTPYLVNPSPANSVAVPTDYSTIGGDAEAVFLGRLEHIYGVGATGEFRSGYSGSVGFVLD